MAARSGPQAAAQVIRRADRLDLTHPENAAALRALVVHLSEAGASDQAVEAARAGVDAHSDAAALREIHALALERAGAPGDQVRAEYERALELELENAHALAGLARLSAAEGNAETALAVMLYCRINACPWPRLALTTKTVLMTCGEPRTPKRWNYHRFMTIPTKITHRPCNLPLAAIDRISPNILTPVK